MRKAAIATVVQTATITGYLIEVRQRRWPEVGVAVLRWRAKRAGDGNGARLAPQGGRA
jgi:hypothetical protein